MTHIFNPENTERLISLERLEREQPEKTLNILNIQPNSRVIDIGCGPGFFLPFLSSAVKKKGFVGGVDIQLTMLDFSRKHLEKHSLKNIYLVQARGENLPFGSETFDRALVAYTFHESANRKHFLKELKRILKPGGMVLVLEWEKGGNMGEIGPPVSERVSGEEFLKLSLSSGFQNLRVEDRPPERYLILLKK